MKCKKHPVDLSCGIGVCATCLSERLSDLIAAQELYSAGKYRRRIDPIPAPVVFPRSVSPYVSRRKNEPDRRFFSTPQPELGLAAARSREKKPSKFAIVSRIFRHKSKKSESNAKANGSCSSSPSWFTQIFSRPRKNELRFTPGERRPNRIVDRGMSPEMNSSDGEECDRSSGISPETHRREVSSAPVTTIQKKPSRGGHARNGSGFTFYMSPLVRASPTRNWSMPSETGFCGEIRVPAKPHMFRANRSKKIADFGRVGYNR